MLVGFIAVIVILLVIVGLMSAGGTSGSGGVDQTKATKVVSEISALAQSAGFFKTTTTQSNYEGMNVAALIDAGIIDSADAIVFVDADGSTGLTIVDKDDVDMIGEAVEEDAIAVEDAQYVKSKAVAGVYYNVAVDAADATNNTMIIELDIDQNLPTTLRKAIDKVSTKLDNVTNSNLDSDGAARPQDGAFTVRYK